MIKKIINTIKQYKPPKFVIYMILIIPIVFCYINNIELDNDTWFLLNYGRYVLEHGIPYIEPFSMHSNLSFVMQQWLSASIFWIVYKYFGIIGLRFLIIGVFSLIIFIVYKLCMLVSDNKYYLSSVITIIFSVLIAIFMVSRPQIFTYLILVLELYLLELYIHKKDKKYLCFLPVLSLLLINLHASMWFMLFCFMLPYLIDSFKIDFGFIKTESYNNKPLFLILIIMLVVGFINPYGIDAITYVFNSYGVKEINEVVSEMKSLNISNFIGKLGFISIFSILFVYIFYKKGNIKLRYFLLYCGTLYLLISHNRNLPLFVIASLFPLADYLREKYDVYKNKFYNVSNKFMLFYKLICFLLIVVACVCFIGREYTAVKLNVYKSINYILDKYDKNNITIYTNYNDGAYAQFKGLKTYIDPRAEVYLKANNKTKDVFIEYYNLQFKKINVDVFLDKYKFDILLLEKEDKLYYENLPNYKLVYNDEYRSVYERIKK